MKILYKQHDMSQRTHLSCLDSFGITRCYFKEISYINDSNLITKKTHHHTGFEIHIITSGYQTYEINGKTYKIKAGNFILITPNIEHRVIDSTQLFLKHSITFDSTEKISTTDYITGKVPKRVQENIQAITEYKKTNKKISNIIIENTIFEIIIILLRLSGLIEASEANNSTIDDPRIAIAKQYISDNIEQNLTISDIAQYCNLSSKQFTRIFEKNMGTSPTKYIHTQRVLHIEELLNGSNLTLKEISELMNFHNEYYFNAFFKKHSGQPPGEFRKNSRQSN